MLLNKKFNSTTKYTLHLYSNNYYNLLEDFLLLKRYFYRYFNYSISFSVHTNSLIKQKKINLLKSPFVHKKAQEHFAIATYSKTINFFFLFKLDNIFQFYWLFFLIFTTTKKLTSSNKLSYSYLI